MKEEDLSVLYGKAKTLLEVSEYDLVDDIGLTCAANCVAMIYYTNDLMSGFGQDYNKVVSVIASPTRISIIKDGRHSYYRDNIPICGYEDVDEDLQNIVNIIQVVYDRLAE